MHYVCISIHTSLYLQWCWIDCEDDVLWLMVAQAEVLIVVPQAEVTQIGQAATMKVINCQVKMELNNNTFCCSRCLNTNKHTKVFVLKTMQLYTVFWKPPANSPFLVKPKGTIEYTKHCLSFCLLLFLSYTLISWYSLIHLHFLVILLLPIIEPQLSKPL